MSIVDYILNRLGRKRKETQKASDVHFDIDTSLPYSSYTPIYSADEITLTDDEHIEALEKDKERYSKNIKYLEKKLKREKNEDVRILFEDKIFEYKQQIKFIEDFLGSPESMFVQSPDYIPDIIQAIQALEETEIEDEAEDFCPAADFEKIYKILSKDLEETVE